MQVLQLARSSDAARATELLEAVLSVDLAHPNIVQTYLTSTRDARKVGSCKALANLAQQEHCCSPLSVPQIICSTFIGDPITQALQIDAAFRCQPSILMYSSLQALQGMLCSLSHALIKGLSSWQSS